MSTNRNILILMYHGTPATKPASIYSLRADLFAQHIRFLKQKGWHSICLRDLSNPDALREKTVAITFDDGYLDNFANAYQPLLENGMYATWFITSDVIGKHAYWMGQSDDMRMLTRDHLVEMASNGMEIGSHTCSHPDLTELPYDQQLDEFQRSKDLLENTVIHKVESLAYPFGRYNQDSVRAAEYAGYRLACTTRSGHHTNSEGPLQLRRVTIFDGDSRNTLARKLVFSDNNVSWKRMARYYSSRIISRLTGWYEF